MREENKEFAGENQNMSDKKNSLTENNSMALRIIGTLMLLFARDADSYLLELLTREKIPGYQRQLAIWESGIRKLRDLRHALVQLVKGEAPRAQRLAALKALTRIGNICSQGASETLIIDLLDVYLHTTDPKLYSGLHSLLLDEADFAVTGFVKKTIIERCDFSESISAESWEILARSLHLSFQYKLRRNEATFRKSLKSLPPQKDKEREELEKTASLIRQIVGLAVEIRDEIRSSLAGDEKGEQVRELLSSSTLNRSFHEKCDMLKIMKPVISYILDQRPGIRLIVVDELSDITSPLAYEYYGALIQRSIKGYPETPKLMLRLLSNLSRIDPEALEVFLSLGPRIGEEEVIPFSEGITGLLTGEISQKIVDYAMRALREKELPDRLAQELVTRVLGEKISPDTLRFLIEMAVNEDVFTKAVRKRAIKMLLKYNRPEYPLYEEISQCIKSLSSEDGNQDIRQFIYKEIKEIPLLDNISYLREGIYDPREEVRKGALRSYCELVKSSQIERDGALSFFTSLLSDKSEARQDVQVQILDFLKTNSIRNEALREKVFSLISSDVKELRNHAFELMSFWLNNPVDEAEGWVVLFDFMSLLERPGFPHDDIYTRIAKIVSSGLSEKSPLFEKKMKEIFIRIQDALCKALSNFQVKILCEILDVAASGKNKSARVQAYWIMENLMRNKDAPVIVSLHVLQLLITKQGKIVQFFPRLLEFMKVGDSYTRKVALEILAGGSVPQHKWTAEEKLKALENKAPEEIYEYVKWELVLNKDFLHILVQILSDPATDQDVIVLALGIIRRIECARSVLDIVFCFRDARFGDLIRERTLESVAFLLYPPFSVKEEEIVSELKKIASDVSIGPNYRLSSLHALVHIGYDEMYEYFLELAGNGTDRSDIRLLCLQGLNAIKNPEVVKFYLSCLNNPRYSVVHKETILDGLRDVGRSLMIEPLLQLIFVSENPKLQEKARNALVTGGYSLSIDIRALYLDIQKKKEELTSVESIVAELEKRIRVADSESRDLESRIGVLRDAASSEEDRLASEKKKIEEEQLKWDSQKEKIEHKLKELAPEWPSEKKIPKDLREPFLIAKEEYIQFSEKYEKFSEEARLRIQDIEIRLEELRNGLAALIDKLEQRTLELKSLQKDLNHNNEKKTSLIFEIRNDEEHCKVMGETFKDDLKRLDDSNMAKIQSYRENRMKEWNFRWEYYQALMKLTGSDTPLG